MIISERHLKKAEEEINNKIENLKQKVNSNQGNVILTSREIILGKHSPTFGLDSMNYTEAGIIQGELEFFDGVLKTPNIEIIKSIGLMDSNHFRGDYMYAPEFQITVKNKLSRSCMAFGLNFLIEDLENFQEEGIIGIGKLEFEPELRKGFCSTPGMDLPYLNSLEILIGEEEIQNFAKGKVQKRDADDFFNLVKHTKEVGRRINENYYNQRQKLATELVQNVVQLSISNNRIKRLEENVLRAKFEHYDRGEGEWATPYESDVHEYEGLREISKKLFYEVEKGFNDAEKNQLTKLLTIDLKVLGIPGDIRTEDFLDYSKKNVFSDYSERVKKMDEHIRKEING